MLYLTHSGLLDVPVLYISRWITGRKGNYYRLLQAVLDTRGSADEWEAWLLYMIHGVAQTAKDCWR